MGALPSKVTKHKALPSFCCLHSSKQKNQLWTLHCLSQRWETIEEIILILFKLITVHIEHYVNETYSNTSFSQGSGTIMEEGLERL